MLALISAILLLLLIMGGLWIAFAIAIAGIVGLWPQMGEAVLPLIAMHSQTQTTSFTLTAVPMFLLMGEIVFRSGLTDRLYRSASVVVQGLPGGLIQANIGATALFAASSGSSVAASAALAPMTFEEEVVKRNYHRGSVLGSIAAGGTLGILLPPSIIMIIYGAATGTSIGRLFLAGILPGLLAVALMSVYIGVRSWRDPMIAPLDVDIAHVGLRTRMRAGVELWPFGALAAVVLGSIYAGWATATEAASIGTLMAVVLGVALADFNLRAMLESLLATARTTSMIFLIIIAAQIMAAVLSYNGIPARAGALGEAVQPGVAVIGLLIMYLVLGAFFDAISMMVLTLPFALPIVLNAGLDPVWFGVILVIVIEIGLLTPPVGINLFVMQGVTGVPLGEVIRGVVPFLAILVLLTGLLIAFPEIVLFLPDAVFD